MTLVVIPRNRFKDADTWLIEQGVISTEAYVTNWNDKIIEISFEPHLSHLVLEFKLIFG